MRRYALKRSRFAMVLLLGAHEAAVDLNRGKGRPIHVDCLLMRMPENTRSTTQRPPPASLDCVLHRARRRNIMNGNKTC